MAADNTAGGRARAAGLVLAGGLSRRFGRDKATAPWRGAALIRHPVAALEAVCSVVAVSALPGGGGEAWAQEAGLAVVHDDPAHPRGPLAGLAAGLAWAKGAGFGVLVSLPCDTPRVRPSHLVALLDALGEAPAVYAATSDGPHALCAAWPTSLAGPLAARLAAGEHPPVRRLLAEIGACPIVFEDAAAFVNVNWPDDLQA